MTRGIVGILLAAGQSERFKGNKLLYPLADSMPIALAAAQHLCAVLPDTIAVVSDGHGDVVQLLENAGLQIIVNRRAHQGIGTSIACGVTASQDAQGWVVALADMPFVPEKIVQSVVAGLQHGSDVVAPVYRQQRGHPVGFSRRHANALMKLSTDDGARSVIAMNRATLDLIEVDEEGVVIDIDTIDDPD